MREKKVACIVCSSGKRACSGTFPCERCKRLGKPCGYAEDVIRRGLIPGLGPNAGPETEVGAGPSSAGAATVPLMIGPASGNGPAFGYGGFGGASFGGTSNLNLVEAAAAAVLVAAATGGASSSGATLSSSSALPAVIPRQTFNWLGPSFAQPRPNRLHLPPQLFPWQDVRLYSCNPVAKQGQADGPAYREDSGSRGSISRGSEADTRALYLRFLWDSTTDTRAFKEVRTVSSNRHQRSAAPASRKKQGTKGHGDDFEGVVSDSDAESDGADEDQRSAVTSSSEPSARKRRRSSAGDHQAVGSTPPAPKRARADSHSSAVGISILAKAAAGGGFESPAPASPALPPAPVGDALREVSALSRSERDKELEKREAIVAEAVMKETEPAWLCIYDTDSKGSFGLKHVLMNRAAQLLFAVTQAEVNLRVTFGKAIRWLHPESVVERSVQEVQARKQRLKQHTIANGRYLSRRVEGAQRVPETALLTIARAARFGVGGGISNSGEYEQPAAEPSSNASSPALPAASTSLGRVGSQASAAAGGHGLSDGSTYVSTVVTGLQAKDKLRREASGAAHAASSAVPPMPASNPSFGQPPHSSTLASAFSMASSHSGGLTRVASSLGPGQPLLLSYPGYDSLVASVKTNLALAVAVQHASSASSGPQAPAMATGVQGGPAPPTQRLGIIETALRIGNGSVVERDELLLALEELDDALVYTVFEADEHVTCIFTDEDEQIEDEESASEDDDTEEEDAATRGDSSGEGESAEEDGLQKLPNKKRERRRPRKAISRDASGCATVHMTITRFRLRAQGPGGKVQAPVGYLAAHKELVRGMKGANAAVSSSASAVAGAALSDSPGATDSDEDSDDGDADAMPEDEQGRQALGKNNRSAGGHPAGPPLLRALDIELEEDIALEEGELEARLREAHEQELLLRASAAAAAASSQGRPFRVGDGGAFLGDSAVPTAIPVAEAYYPHPQAYLHHSGLASSSGYYMPSSSLLVKGPPPGYYASNPGPQLPSSSSLVASLDSAGQEQAPHNSSLLSVVPALPVSYFTAGLPPSLMPMPLGRGASGLIVPGSSWLLQQSHRQQQQPERGHAGDAPEDAAASAVLDSGTSGPSAELKAVSASNRGPGARGGASQSPAVASNSRKSKAAAKVAEPAPNGKARGARGAAEVQGDAAASLPPPRLSDIGVSFDNIPASRIEGLETTGPDEQADGANGSPNAQPTFGFLPPASKSGELGSGVGPSSRLDSSESELFGLGPPPQPAYGTSAAASNPPLLQGSSSQALAGASHEAGDFQFTIGIGEPLFPAPPGTALGLPGPSFFMQQQHLQYQRQPSFLMPSMHPQFSLADLQAPYGGGVGNQTAPGIPVAMPANIAFAAGNQLSTSSGWLFAPPAMVADAPSGSTSTTALAGPAAPAPAASKTTTKPPVMAVEE